VNSVTIKLDGVQGVLNELNSQIAKIQGRTRKGLIEAGLMILAKAQKNTPVDTGNLKASASLIPSAMAAVPTPVWDTDSKNPKRKNPTHLSGETISELSAGFETMVGESKAEIASDATKHIDSVIVGYGAYYAVFVHEKAGPKMKFLENAVKSETNAVLERIRRRAVIA